MNYPTHNADGKILGVEGVGSRRWFLRPKRKCLEHASVVPGSLNWPMFWTCYMGHVNQGGPWDLQWMSKHDPTSDRSEGDVLL